MLKAIEERIAREIELAPALFQKNLCDSDRRRWAARAIASEVMVGLRLSPDFRRLMHEAGLTSNRDNKS